MDSGKFVKSVCELGVRLFFFFFEEKGERRSRHMLVDVACWHSGSGFGNSSDESGLCIFKYLRRSE